MNVGAGEKLASNWLAKMIFRAAKHHNWMMFSTVWSSTTYFLYVHIVITKIRFVKLL